MSEPHSLPRRGARAAPLLLALVLSCTSRPSAPVLENGAVYTNAHEGFRFSTPEGWRQYARGDIPSGPVKGERMLVEYRCQTCTKPATLAVTVAAIAPADVLPEFVAKNTLTGEQWQLVGAPEEFTINELPAVRLVYGMAGGKGEMVRDIVAFRRGERVYFFKGFYARTDARARKEFRAAIDTIVW